MKTKLQLEFESQTPTIKGIKGNEYNLVYCAWLELQVERSRNTKQAELQEVAREYISKNEPFLEEYDEGGYLGTDEAKLAQYLSDFTAYIKQVRGSKYCNLYKKECMDSFCSVTPFTDTCEHL